MIFDAIRGLPVTLVLKPHYANERADWRKIIQELKPANKVRVVSHSDDFFKLLLDSDAMAVSYWSTALIEAGLAGIPAIYLDLNSQKSPVVHEAAGWGLCRLVQSPEELRKEM